ncbi:helix-turn-helix domain-containing protein [Roseateles sp. SL47]|uniref:helix-turn-helix domain-containing protein n=1 Tax=Roseateles sp. SL47 TaxID=2995138 RepID=UPI00226E47E4|nr:helix-turn-helix domain-containing protein [Roseateles sp. SL47]WAC75352.1 helix-turn-helix domain-containing protein [Roseateles sp. SL47]
MARPSKLTERQWEEIRRRILEGERPTDLAREFKVSKATISNRVSKRADAVKVVANQIVATNAALSELSISEQIQAVSLAARLRAISDNLASAAHYGAATAHRLQALANSEVAKIDDADPLKSGEALKGIMVLGKLANESASIALNLVAANKDAIKKAEEEAAQREIPTSLDHFYGADPSTSDA